MTASGRLSSQAGVVVGNALTKRQPGSKDAGLRRLLDGSVARKVTRLVVRDSD